MLESLRTFVLTIEFKCLQWDINQVNFSDGAHQSYNCVVSILGFLLHATVVVPYKCSYIFVQLGAGDLKKVWSWNSCLTLLQPSYTYACANFLFQRKICVGDFMKNVVMKWQWWGVLDGYDICWRWCHYWCGGLAAMLDPTLGETHEPSSWPFMFEL